MSEWRGCSTEVAQGNGARPIAPPVIAFKLRRTVPQRRVGMARRGRSIIMLLAALWTASVAWPPGARGDDAARTTVARQDYAYDPGTESVTLDLVTVYSGQDAEAFRALYREMGAEGYSRAKLDYYRTMYSA